MKILLYMMKSYSVAGGDEKCFTFAVHQDSRSAMRSAE